MIDTTLNKPSIRKVYWQDVREDVASVNPDFAKIVDDISPGKDYPLYLARYPYGSVISDEGRFFLPTDDGMLASLDSHKIPDDIKNELRYSGGHIPAGILLDHAMEVFVRYEDKVLPWIMHKSGVIFGMWAYLEPSTGVFHPPLFNITAGSRCAFMLPNIGDVGLHKNLRRDFNVRLPAPKDLYDQWAVFREITKHPASNCMWSTNLLFFANKWLEKIKSDPAWYRLYILLLNSAWKLSAYWRNQMFYDFALSCAQANRNLKPNPYLVDTVKHLMAIGIGAAPGFGVGINDEVMPISVLQKAYIESYGLRKHVPTIMHPVYFSLQDFDRVVYYSLQFPTTLEFSPKSRKLSSTLHDLSELKHITNVFVDEVLRGRLKIESTEIGKLVEIACFEFYHNKHDRHGEIKLTKEMIKHDPYLLLCDSSDDEREFADSGTFVRGCVQIFKEH